MKVAVIGYGYWGPNIARNFASLDGASLKAVCDKDPKLLNEARKTHPQASVTDSFESILADGEIDAVCIATPALTHADLALRALRAGKHVLVEKPMAMSLSECEKMASEADKRGLVLMVDHTFAYSAPVRKLRELASGGELGDLYYFDSVRINLGIVQSDVNVMWDLAIHDLSILFEISREDPVSVSASGVSHIKDAPIDTAYITLHYNSSFISHIHVSWLAPAKIRLTTVAGDKKMAIYDDTQPMEKLKVYDSGVDMKSASKEYMDKLFVEYRSGDIHSPKLGSSEPLSLLAAEFRDSVKNGSVPLTGFESGAKIIRILEAADISIKKNGERISLESSFS